MKLKSIHLKNLLSYGDEKVEFNDDLNIFVGANGSGKSNLMNIIIYVLKRFCFRNYEIGKIMGPEFIEIKKYSIRQKAPSLSLTEDFFLQKHKLKPYEASSIELEISFGRNDVKNLYLIKQNQEKIIQFLDEFIDNIQFLEDKNSVNKHQVMRIFEVSEDDLSVGKSLHLLIHESSDGWILESENSNFVHFIKYLSLIQEIFEIQKISDSIINPFIFFEAYRNNSGETTKVGLMDYPQFSSPNKNLQSWANLRSLNNSIGTNSTYIMLATKKYGKLMREAIEEVDGLRKFNEIEEYKKLKIFFAKFNYDINLKCISPENNIYQFYVIKDGLSIEIDTISSGEREIINFIFGLFIEQLDDGIIIIDEPELHLHPKWQKKLINILKEITHGIGIQILFVTHSSSFISYNVLNNIFRIYKDAGFSKCIKVDNLLTSEDNNLRKKLSVINATNNEKIFFADNVILVEGITDEILFKKIYESEFGDLPDGLEFVNINGKMNRKNFEVVLDKLQIKHFYIGDYDNLNEYSELENYLSVDTKKQINDLNRSKNQSYSALNLLSALKEYIDKQNVQTFQELKSAFKSYNSRFQKNECPENEYINRFITNQYSKNIYILRAGEIEDYLGTGNSDKSTGFKKVISISNDNEKYKEFSQSKNFEELKMIITDIHNKIKNNGL